MKHVAENFKETLKLNELLEHDMPPTFNPCSVDKVLKKLKRKLL